MKKVLFATTALVASAGIASAQGVELSGSAEMGIIGGDGMETQFHHDFDIKFSLSGETDNGLTFGATIDLDEVSAGISNTANPSSVFISGSFGTITMGDTDGAFDWALQDLDIVADINDTNTSHGGFSGNSGLDGGNLDGRIAGGVSAHDGQIARYDYSFGDFAFAVSAELDDTGLDNPTFGIGGKYSGDLGGVTLGVGLGYQTSEFVGTDVSVWGISLDAAMDNGIRGVLNYSSFDVGGPNDLEHLGVGVFYTMDALTLGANYGNYSLAGGDNTGYAVVVNYDLGGGAVVQGAFGDTSSCDIVALGCAGQGNAFSLGVAMSF